MSSILRALKKLEHEPRHLQETPPLGSKFVPLADTGPKRSAAVLVVMIIGGGLVCGLVVLAGWWLFTGREKPVSPEPPKISSPVSPRGELAPAAPPAAEVVQDLPPPVEPPKPAAESAAVPEPAAGNAAAPKAAPVIPAAIPEKEAVSPPPALVENVVLPGDKIAAKTESLHQEPETPGSGAGARAPDDEVAAVAPSPGVAGNEGQPEIPVLNDPGMKLQAITWSRDSQKRLAVLNNHILRQGETVNGYRIDTINQDDLVLSEGGKKWRLLFRIK